MKWSSYNTQNVHKLFFSIYQTKFQAPIEKSVINSTRFENLD